MIKSVVFIACIALANISSILASNQKYRGVNLGGWLVLENWITPDSPVYKDGGLPSNMHESGEYQIMQKLGHERGDALMQGHWSKFITEDDFIQIKQKGIDMVRIPIGYWIMDDDNSFRSTNCNNSNVMAPGSLEYLDKAFRWARRSQLKVLVGIHAAMGSQNGDQHSAPPVSGKIQWFDKQEYVDNTLDVVEFIVRRYQNHPAFLGIGLLNEPQHSNDATKFATLKKYYEDAHKLIRQNLHSDCIITFSNAYNEKTEYQQVWQSFLKNDPNVWAEVHKYYIWGFEGQTFDQIKQYVQGHEAQWIKSWPGAELYVGEWSLANHEATFNLTDSQKQEYADIMTTVFQPTHWSYWTWKFWTSNIATYASWNLQNIFERQIMNDTMISK
ncbi:hypothetical protein THRCLA_11246 [Thraustotheca clavata]|nr:hypothetical protein THRCLA_11246 [Thraustotheca clavata]